jgi:hypothetical protein
MVSQNLGGHGVGYLEADAIDEALQAHPEKRALHSHLLYVILAYRGKAGRMNPSLETLARRTCMSQSSVRRALADLRQWELLDWKTGGTGRSKDQRISNQYQIGAKLRELLSPVVHPDEQQDIPLDPPVVHSYEQQDDDWHADPWDSPVVHEPSSPVVHEHASPVVHPDEQGSTSFEAIPLKQTFGARAENARRPAPRRDVLIAGNLVISLNESDYPSETYTDTYLNLAWDKFCKDQPPGTKPSINQFHDWFSENERLLEARVDKIMSKAELA